MDEAQTMLADAGIQLAILAAKGAANTVNNKIKAIRNNKKLEETQNQYEQIITELLADREEAIRIAMGYKSELERIEIGDDDIEYLHNTISSVLDLVNSFLAEGDKIPTEQINSIKSLVSKNTLKSMQLLGFNYKKAIGEPLTNCCASLIESKIKLKNKNTSKNK